MSTLICYDGSTSAKRALEVAHRALGHDQAVLLHVYSPPDAVLADAFSTRSDPASSPSLGRLEEFAGERAEEVVQEGARIAGELGVAVQVRLARSQSSVWQTILEVADDVDADLIVAGTHGLTAVSDRALGSVSGGLIHHSQRPVLIVPAGHPRA